MAQIKKMVDPDALIFKELVQTAEAKAANPTDIGFLAYMKGYEALFEMAVKEAPMINAVEVPCDIGDSLWFVLGGEIYEATVRLINMTIHKDGRIRGDVYADTIPGYASVSGRFSDFGTTIFKS